MKTLKQFIAEVSYPRSDLYKSGKVKPHPDYHVQGHPKRREFFALADKHRVDTETHPDADGHVGVFGKTRNVERFIKAHDKIK